MVLILARDRSCYPRSYSNRYYVGISAVCMKYDIYLLKETDGILKWEEMGKFGKSNNNEGTMVFPKIIRQRKNDSKKIFPFGPDIYLVNSQDDHQEGSQILFENWTKNMTREIEDNFPLTVTNKMSRLRIFQI